MFLPQMMPLSWLILLVTSVGLILIWMNHIYFNPLSSGEKISKYPPTTNFNWKW